MKPAWIVKGQREKEIELMPGVYFTFLTAGMREWQGKMRVNQKEIDKFALQRIELERQKNP